jgi:hypothetical protein
MSSLFAVGFIALCLFYTCVAQVAPVFQYNITLTPDDNSYTTSFPVAINETWSVGTVPCFGSYDWFVGVDFVPNRTVYTSAHLFSQSGNAFTGTTIPGLQDSYTFYVWAESNSNYNGIAAQFDILAYDSDPSETLIPIPGNNGQVSGKLASGGGSGSLKWTGTGDSEDVYQLYSHNGPATDGGNFPFTACGVRRWMQNYTAKSVTNNGDGTYTADVDNLNSKDPFTVTVVAQRPGGYAAAYYSFVFNGASLLQVSYYLLAIVLAIFLVL